MPRTKGTKTFLSKRCVNCFSLMKFFHRENPRLCICCSNRPIISKREGFLFANNIIFLENK